VSAWLLSWSNILDDWGAIRRGPHQQRHAWVGILGGQVPQIFPALLTAVRLGAPGGRLVWASPTPVRKDTPGQSSNARINVRNAIAAEQIAKSGIAVDDQHALMMQDQDLHSDDVHFTAEGSAIQGGCVCDEDDADDGVRPIRVMAGSFDDPNLAQRW